MTVATRAVTTTRRSMGTELTVLAPADRPDAPRIVGALFDEWDARLSRFRPDSELSALNAHTGAPFSVGPLLFDVVRASLAAARATDGLFDPALLTRLVELGYDRTFAELPSDRSARPPGDWTGSGWRAIRLDELTRSVELPQGVALDLGGIAKGMAVDAALAALVQAEVPFAAVSAGGDLGVIGLPPGEERWTIAVDGAGTRSVSLRAGALATSTVLERRWYRGGVPQHHLVDPRSGLPSRSGVLLASVAAASCRQAEVAVKAALLLGPDGGAEFLVRYGLAGLLVTAEGDTWRVGSWEDA